jgi:valyl-tRNA synthetase
MNDDIQLQPAKFKNTYRHWMENVKDWCVSRQLWWGHRIPAYFYGDGHNDYVVAESQEEAVKLAAEKTGNASLQASDLRQDEDVLDTWFSSWLWPISVFDGIRNPENEEIKYYYPTNDLVTAPEILFFWVARMIIAGYEYRNAKPFDTVYLTGIVRDDKRRKMSKSLGNFTMIKDVLLNYHPEVIRLFLLSKHYRSPIDYNEGSTDEVITSLDKIYTFLDRAEKAGADLSISLDDGENWQLFVQAMDDDFNSARGMATIFDAVKKGNRMLDRAGDMVPPEVLSQLSR